MIQAKRCAYGVSYLDTRAAVFFYAESGIVALDPRSAPLGVITRFDVRPSLRHEIEEKMRIVDRK